MGLTLRKLKINKAIHGLTGPICPGSFRKILKSGFGGSRTADSGIWWEFTGWHRLEQLSLKALCRHRGAGGPESHLRSLCIVFFKASQQKSVTANHTRTQKAILTHTQ